MGTPLTDLVLRDALCPVGGSFQRVTLEIQGERIIKIHGREATPRAEKSIEARGKLLLPQVTDCHVHFRDPGMPQKETLITGSRAAAAGGVTCVLDMPNTVPRTESHEALNQKLDYAASHSLVNIGFFIGYKAGSWSFEAGLNQACGLKVFTYELEDTRREITQILKAFHGMSSPPPVAFHAEHPVEIPLPPAVPSPTDSVLKQWNKQRPPQAEVRQVLEILELMKIHPTPIHICHVSVSETIALLLRARQENLPVSWEVTPHHLLLNEETTSANTSWGKVNPPLRSIQEQNALLQALRKGSIPLIASDHAPHAPAEKETGLPLSAPSGIVGVETMIPLLATLVHKGIISLSSLYDLVCLTPAKIYGLPAPYIRPGAQANLTLIDLNKSGIIEGKKLHGKTRHTPFEGYEVHGIVDTTIINGKITFQDGGITINVQDSSAHVLRTYARASASTKDQVGHAHSKDSYA